MTQTFVATGGCCAAGWGVAGLTGCCLVVPFPLACAPTTVFSETWEDVRERETVEVVLVTDVVDLLLWKTSLTSRLTVCV